MHWLSPNPEDGYFASARTQSTATLNRLWSSLPGTTSAATAAARACALDDRGTLAPGMLADIQIWNVPSLEEFVYRLGHNPVAAIVKRGSVTAF